MPVVTDMLGREVNLPEQPKRIVSLVPSQTELLSDLGLEDEIVGITKFCVHPERLFRSKTRVGGTKAVHEDVVKSLRPDLIIANKEENEKAQIESLERISPVWISDIHNLDDALVMIEALSSICGSIEQGHEMIAEIQSSFAMLPKCESRTVAYGIWRDPWMWAGRDTFINNMLKHSCLENVFAFGDRYPTMDLIDMERLKPDIVLLSSEPYPFKEKHIAEVKQALPAANVMLVDGEMFSWYGSRLLLVPEYLSTLMPLW